MKVSMNINELFEVSEEETKYMKKMSLIWTCVGALQSLILILFMHRFSFLKKPLSLKDPIYSPILIFELVTFAAMAFLALKIRPLRKRIELSKTPVRYKVLLTEMNDSSHENKRNSLYKTLVEDYPNSYSTTKKVWEAKNNLN
ncbi:MAG: hypothetical protein S4CHLAM7_06080 [Chlamydiae bacterium]|nr:hypothetical protein [Chlamydiota bacterium]